MPMNVLVKGEHVTLLTSPPSLDFTHSFSSLSPAKEEQYVLEVSGRAAAVGNSR